MTAQQKHQRFLSVTSYGFQVEYTMGLAGISHLPVTKNYSKKQKKYRQK
jgi:hypothetical protein